MKNPSVNRIPMGMFNRGVKRVPRFLGTRALVSPSRWRKRPVEDSTQQKEEGFFFGELMNLGLTFAETGLTKKARVTIVAYWTTGAFGKRQVHLLEVSLSHISSFSLSAFSSFSTGDFALSPRALGLPHFCTMNVFTQVFCVDC